jgi:hypothetical protein
MRRKFFTLFIALIVIVFTLKAQILINFESDLSSMTVLAQEDQKQLTVVDNPVKDTVNRTSKVVLFEKPARTWKYVEVLLPEPVNMKDIGKISLKVYSEKACRIFGKFHDASGAVVAERWMENYNMITANAWVDQVMDFSTLSASDIKIIDGVISKITFALGVDEDTGYKIYIDEIKLVPLSKMKNIALFQKVSVSSEEQPNGAHGITLPFIGEYMVDGNDTTRWSTSYEDPQIAVIQLDKEYTFSKILLKWEAAWGKTYNIYTSRDSVTWNIVYTESLSNGGLDKLVFTPVKAKYVKLEGLTRGNTAYGYSLWEFEIYENAGVNEIPVVIGTIPDKKVVTGKEFYYIIPATLLVDNDGDNLTFEVSLADGKPLPAWLKYTPTLRRLNGTPAYADAGVLTIKIKATDALGGTVETQFKLTVEASSSAINNPSASGFSLYPNPSAGVINFETNSTTPLAIEILNLNGQIIYNNLYKGQTGTIDLTRQSKGIYIMKVKGNNFTKIQKIVIEL